MNTNTEAGIFRGSMYSAFSNKTVQIGKKIFQGLKSHAHFRGKVSYTICILRLPFNQSTLGQWEISKVLYCYPI